MFNTTLFLLYHLQESVNAKHNSPESDSCPSSPKHPSTVSITNNTWMWLFQFINIQFSFKCMLSLELTMQFQLPNLNTTANNNIFLHYIIIIIIYNNKQYSYFMYLFTFFTYLIFSPFIVIYFLFLFLFTELIFLLSVALRKVWCSQCHQNHWTWQESQVKTASLNIAIFNRYGEIDR